MGILLAPFTTYHRYKIICVIHRKGKLTVTRVRCEGQRIQYTCDLHEVLLLLIRSPYNTVYLLLFMDCSKGKELIFFIQTY